MGIGHTSNPNHHTCKAIFLRSETSYPAPVEATNDDFGEGSSSCNDLHVDVEHEDDLGGREEKEVFEEEVEKKEEEVEKKDEEVEEKRDEVEREKEKRVLDQEERWKEIQERTYGRLYAPPLPFPYKAVEKQLQAKFLKFLEHIR